MLAFRLLRFESRGMTKVVATGMATVVDGTNGAIGDRKGHPRPATTARRTGPGCIYGCNRTPAARKPSKAAPRNSR
jgi:hypothetical protein